MLITDIHEDLTVRKQAFLMTQLLQQYLDYLPAHIPNTYPVTKLRDRLKIHYGDSIVVQIQRGQGKSNLVFSSDVSIGHVATAGNLKSKLKTNTANSSRLFRRSFDSIFFSFLSFLNVFFSQKKHTSKFNSWLIL
jgi:hypothetical protein